MRSVCVGRASGLVALLGCLSVATPVGAQGAVEEGAAERSREYSVGVGRVYADYPPGTYFALRVTRMWTRAGWRPSATFEMDIVQDDPFYGRLSVGAARVFALPRGITFVASADVGPTLPAGASAAVAARLEYPFCGGDAFGLELQQRLHRGDGRWDGRPVLLVTWTY